jgi:azurin
MKIRYLAFALALVVGCKKEEPVPAPREQQVAATASAPAATAKAEAVPSAPEPIPPPAPPKKVELAISAVGATMVFDKTALTVPAGAEVHLTMKVSPPGALSHNWVLVNTGTEAQVAADGLAKGPKENYVAPGPNVLAYTPLIAPGKTGEVTFTAPAAGTYPYICTFPGHYMMMKGVLTVTP